MDIRLLPLFLYRLHCFLLKWIYMEVDIWARIAIITLTNSPAGNVAIVRRTFAIPVFLRGILSTGVFVGRIVPCAIVPLSI